jgi:glycosyltransferase involved in cell wall biosynthesis
LGPDCTVSYTLDLDSADFRDADVAHLQWIEYLVDKKDATRQDVRDVVERLQNGPPLVVTRHNYLPHQLSPDLGRVLYEKVYEVAECIVHLGQFSVGEYETRYPQIAKNQNHYVVHHPIYTFYPNSVSRGQARKKLGIPQRSFVVLVFGIIRNREEKAFIEETFNRLNVDNKVLLVPRMIAFRGATRLSTTVRKFMLNLYGTLERITFNRYYEFRRLSDEEIQFYLTSADVLLIPRQDTLNSGLPFLGWSFGKMVVGPAVGNIGEAIQLMGHPTYEPGNVEMASKAIEEVVDFATQFTPNDIHKLARSHFDPESVGQQTETILRKHARSS